MLPNGREVLISQTRLRGGFALINRVFVGSGRGMPARAQRLSLWRVEAGGRRILTARGLVRPDGTYGIDRRFTGSGRFGFQVDVAATQANLWGQSGVRPTVIH